MTERSTLRIVFRQTAKTLTAETEQSKTPRYLMDQIQQLAFLEPTAVEAIRGFVRDKLASHAAKTARSYRIALAALSLFGSLGH